MQLMKVQSNEGPTGVVHICERIAFGMGLKTLYVYIYIDSCVIATIFPEPTFVEFLQRLIERKIVIWTRDAHSLDPPFIFSLVEPPKPEHTRTTRIGSSNIKRNIEEMTD